MMFLRDLPINFFFLKKKGPDLIRQTHSRFKIQQGNLLDVLHAPASSHLI